MRLIHTLFALAIVLISLPSVAGERQDLMPRVFEKSQVETTSIWCKDVPEGYRCEGPVAIYSAGTMIVRSGLDMTDPKQVAVLLHEFVHHLQHLSGVDLCQGEKEAQAYAVQEAWLKQNGTPPKEPYDFFPGPLKRKLIESHGCGDF